MKKLLYLCLVILSWNTTFFAAEKPIKFAIVIPSYNNEPWCIENLESCVNQTYKNFIIIYVDDCSTDKTGELIDNYVATHNLKNKVFVIHNQQRVRQLANFYKVIHALDPHIVVVNVDGDDKLMHCHVLEILAKVYQDPNIWLTYGDFTTDDPHFKFHCKRFPKKVIKNKTYRQYKWTASHLRTYYAGLFQHIKKEDLSWSNGEFFPKCADVAMMFPMIEMASPNHFRYIPDILYWYRTINPNNDIAFNHSLAQQLSIRICSQKPYPSLNSLFPDDTHAQKVTKAIEAK
jgi:glycosyltransferase involved in cell wall biosynthesis